MSTLNQKSLLFSKFTRKRKVKTPLLVNHPQKKGICIQLKTLSPKKPNSGRRKISKVRVFSNKFKIVSVYVPGESHSLQKHNVVLVRGGHVRDVPGMKYKCIPGVYDFKPVKRFSKRSKYGTTLSLYRLLKKQELGG